MGGGAAGTCAATVHYSFSVGAPSQAGGEGDR